MALVGPLLRALGGEKNGNGILCPTPGHSARDRGMRIWPDPTDPLGFKVHLFNGEDWQSAKVHVRRALGVQEWQFGAAKISAPRPVINTKFSYEQSDNGDRKRIDRAMTLWKEAVQPIRTMVERYLQHRRLSLRKDILDADALRLHPSCPFRLEDGTTVRLPAMLALMRD